jgi:flagellar L-ring protein precursor FlgH
MPLFIIFIIFSLVSCADMRERIKNIGKAPDLNQVEAPMEKKGYKPVAWSNYDSRDVDMAMQKANSNSLWKPGARAFFRDQRARRVGDILKVSISINDNVKMGNKTEHIRSNKSQDGVNSVLGLEKKFKNILPNINPASLVSITGADDIIGEGKISRQEAVNTQIAATVTQILPNGNLVIRGHQEVRVNFELREVKVDGIVRPEDISSENIINSDLIAEARISYGGRGNITNLQQPRYGNQLLDVISPF